MVEPKEYTYEDFPESEASSEGMKNLQADMSAAFCVVRKDVEHAVKDGESLHLQIIEPVVPGEEEKRYPLVIYVQGSAWYKQDMGMNLPQLSRFAARGYVVASVEYRPTTTAPFPAQLVDTKTAIRYMIKNADQYRADADNIVIWGDSSGGHTSVMVNVTAGDSVYSDEPEDAAPICIKACVDYYGPTDVSKMNDAPSATPHITADTPEGMLIGGHNVWERSDLAAPTNPIYHLSKDKKIAPILIIHGSKDRIVPFEQSVLLADALNELGHEAEFYKLRGADHGGGAFWTEEVLDIVDGFMKRQLV